MTIVDDEVEGGAAEDRGRPWWFAPALVGIALGAVVGLAVVPPTRPTRGTALVSAEPSKRETQFRAPSPTAAVRPSDLPRLPQEAEIVRAMASVGVNATAVGYSSFDDALGPALPARVFVLEDYGAADVLFLDTVGDIHVCATATPRGLVYRVTVDGHETRSIDGARPIAFLVDRRLFIIAWDERAASMLQLGLNVARAPC